MEVGDAIPMPGRSGVTCFRASSGGTRPHVFRRTFRGKSVDECKKALIDERRGDASLNGAELTMDARGLCWIVQGLRGVKGGAKNAAGKYRCLQFVAEEAVAGGDPRAEHTEADPAGAQGQSGACSTPFCTLPGGAQSHSSGSEEANPLHLRESHPTDLCLPGQRGCFVKGCPPPSPFPIPWHNRGRGRGCRGDREYPLSKGTGW